MKTFTVLLLSVLTINLYGQQKKTINSSSITSNIQIGINFSPDFNYRLLTNDKTDAAVELISNYRNDNEIAKIGYTAGINACFNFNDLFGLETGIQYSNKGYQTRKKTLVFEQPDPNSGTIAKVVSNFRYLDIPLKVNFIFGKKTVRFSAGAGFTTNIFLKANQKLTIGYADGKTKRQTSSSIAGYNKINISPILSMGLYLKIDSKTNLRIEPTFRYGILKIIDKPIKEYLWNTGLNITYYVKI